MPWIVKLYSRRQLIRKDRIANYRISRSRRMVENVLVSRFRVLLGTTFQRLMGYMVFTCVVLHNMLRTHQGGADRAPTPANDAAVLQNEEAMYVPNENYRRPSKEAKHQRKSLKDYFNNVGALVDQEDRIQDVSTNNPSDRSWHLSVLFRTTISHES